MGYRVLEETVSILRRQGRLPTKSMKTQTY
jgi:hypothetical protein